MSASGEVVEKVVLVVVVVLFVSITVAAGEVMLVVTGVGVAKMLVVVEICELIDVGD